MTHQINYLLPIFSYALKGKDTVSECQLANALGHHEHSKTLLLSTDIEGKTYRLSLVGGMEIFDNEGNEYFHSQNHSIPPEVVRDIERGESDQYEVTLSACYQWEDEQGNSLGDCLEYIHLDTDKELERLALFLR